MGALEHCHGTLEAAHWMIPVCQLVLSIDRLPNFQFDRLYWTLDSTARLYMARLGMALGWETQRTEESSHLRLHFDVTEWNYRVLLVLSDSTPNGGGIQRLCAC